MQVRRNDCIYNDNTRTGLRLVLIMFGIPQQHACQPIEVVCGLQFARACCICVETYTYMSIVWWMLRGLMVCCRRPTRVLVTFVGSGVQTEWTCLGSRVYFGSVRLHLKPQLWFMFCFVVTPFGIGWPAMCRSGVIAFGRDTAVDVVRQS